jgi:hypothetical protein
LVAFVWIPSIVASCFSTDGFFAFDVRKVCAPQLLPINKESHCEKFLALSAFGKKPLTIRLSSIPLEIIVDVVFYLNESFCSGVSLLKIIGNSN